MHKYFWIRVTYYHEREPEVLIAEDTDYGWQICGSDEGLCENRAMPHYVEKIEVIERISYPKGYE